MQSPPISQVEIDARIHSHIDELLELWWAEQGASKPKDLDSKGLRELSEIDRLEAISAPTSRSCCH